MYHCFIEGWLKKNGIDLRSVVLVVVFWGGPDVGEERYYNANAIMPTAPTKPMPKPFRAAALSSSSVAEGVAPSAVAAAAASATMAEAEATSPASGLFLILSQT